MGQEGAGDPEFLICSFMYSNKLGFLQLIKVFSPHKNHENLLKPKF